MKLSVGIVGLPNVGKSTLFQALTKKPVDIANYPFCTVEPNVGIATVQDARLEKLSQLFKPEKTIPAIVEFVDIAGLVKGAAAGEGLGNKFLAHIREVASILHVVRCFKDPEITHVEGAPDPLRDIETIRTELALKDMETVDRRMFDLQRDAKTGKKEVQEELEILSRARAALAEGKPIAEAQPNLHLLSAKPVLYVLNAESSDVSVSLRKKLESMDMSFIALNIKEEFDMAGLNEAGLTELGMAPRLPELIAKSYELLGLITFFTAGSDEVRAWTIRKETRAPTAGAVIHSDFETKFIKAMVVPSEQLLESESIASAASRGLVRTEGKEYEVQDGDVIEFKHG
ncbi:MAG: redox-regulated ATPase YchF [Parcubacteria group bacterium]|nr:redox-regulated ATPase YchF [Parcubacteria group bacterium]